MLALLIIFVVTVLCLNFKKITGTAGADGSKYVKIMVQFKYSTNFWITLEMPLINCEINLMLTSSKNFIISSAAPNQDTEFAITDAKLYVPVVTLSTEDNAKLSQQLKSSFKKKQLIGIIINQK